MPSRGSRMSIRSPVSPSLSPPPPPALSPSPASGVTADDHCCCTPDPCGATASPHSKLLFLWNGHHSLGFHRADKRRTPEDTNFRPDRQRGIARRLSSLAMHMTCSTLCLVPTAMGNCLLQVQCVHEARLDFLFLFVVLFL